MRVPSYRCRCDRSGVLTEYMMSSNLDMWHVNFVALAPKWRYSCTAVQHSLAALYQRLMHDAAAYRYLAEIGNSPSPI